MVRKTSIEVYRRIVSEGLLSKRRLDIYSVLFHEGPLTANEVFKRLLGKSNINSANTGARLFELREMGAAEETGTRKCSVTGNNVIVWDVTGKLPKKPPKEDFIKCPHCKGTGKIKQGRLF